MPVVRPASDEILIGLRRGHLPTWLKTFLVIRRGAPKHDMDDRVAQPFLDEAIGRRETHLVTLETAGMEHDQSAVRRGYLSGLSPGALRFAGAVRRQRSRRPASGCGAAAPHQPDATGWML